MGSRHTHAQGGSHSHAHSYSSAAARHRGRLQVVLGLTVTVLVAEAVGSLLTGSLALLADAGHMLTDATGVGLALLAVAFAARPATPERTYGYLRLEILAAAANAVLLFAVGVYVLVQATRRMVDPVEVEAGGMLGFALVGLAVNAVCLALLRRGASESLNVRGAYLEVLADLLGSAAVVVAALVIALTGFLRADPIVSALIGVMVLPRTWMLLREAVDVLLEATPKGVDLAEVRRHLTEVPGVLDVHDLHAWTITSGMPVLSAHVVVEDGVMRDGGRMLDRLGECLGGHFAIEHCTFQLEPAGHAAHEGARHH